MRTPHLYNCSICASYDVMPASLDPGNKNLVCTKCRTGVWHDLFPHTKRESIASIPHELAALLDAAQHISCTADDGYAGRRLLTLSTCHIHREDRMLMLNQAMCDGTYHAAGDRSHAYGHFFRAVDLNTDEPLSTPYDGKLSDNFCKLLLKLSLSAYHMFLFDCDGLIIPYLPQYE